MREIVEQGSEEGCNDENLGDVGAACHLKYRTWRPRRTKQVAMSASNNRRAILVLFMTATQGAPNHHIRPRIGDFRADLAVAKPAVCRGGAR